MLCLLLFVPGGFTLLFVPTLLCAYIDTADEQAYSSLWAPVLKQVISRNSLKYQVLDQAAGTLDQGAGTLQWLEVTPSSCTYVSGVGPVDVVRMVVSSSLLYQVDVAFPVVRNVKRLKGIIFIIIIMV